jgi:predicted phosphodiesterase
VKKIIIVGDLHNEFSRLNELINHKKPELVICCGDFGFWPNVSWAAPLDTIKTQDCKVLWCDGNHENHWALRDRTTDELAPNVIYMPRGSTYTLPDGRVIMFMGGGDSIDKDLRKVGVDWFPEEVIQQKDMYNLPDIKVDIFITHTCPVELVNELRRFYEKEKEPSNWALSELRKKYKPSLWFFGHWHMYREGKLFNTKWYCLSHPGQGERWWMYLPEKEVFK